MAFTGSRGFQFCSFFNTEPLGSEFIVKETFVRYSFGGKDTVDILNCWMNYDKRKQLIGNYYIMPLNETEGLQEIQGMQQMQFR